MRGVAVWIDRSHPDGHREAEAHLGGAAPFIRWLRDRKTGRVVTDDQGRPVADPAYAHGIAKLLLPYNEQNARDVALDLDARKIRADKTGCLRALAVVLAEIAERSVARQRRGERGVQRAVWLADLDLAQMVVHVRAE